MVKEISVRAVMTDERKDETSWSDAERAALRKLLRMALIILLAIVVAGTAAAVLSSVAMA